MSRIYWNSMLLIYPLEGNADYLGRAEELLARAFRRRDELFTSWLALGEVMAGAERSPHRQESVLICKTLEEIGFSFLAFNEGAVSTFSTLRGREKLKAPDAIHLACAASAGVDLFLAGDKQLTRLDAPGIQFIADFTSSIF